MNEPALPALRDYGDFTASHFSALDAQAVELGVDMAALMAVAGWQVARLAWRALGEKAGVVAIAAGSGNNGGDALVAARCLHAWGCRVSVGVLAEPARWRWMSLARVLSGEAVPVQVEPDPAALLTMLQAPRDLAIDGLLGTGQREAPRPATAAVIGALTGRVLAIDVPSGVDASSGDIPGVAVTASLTLTLTAMKHGLWSGPAREHCGDLTVADVGIPAGAWSRCGLVPPRAIAGGELLPVPYLTR